MLLSQALEKIPLNGKTGTFHDENNVSEDHGIHGFNPSGLSQLADSVGGNTREENGT